MDFQLVYCRNCSTEPCQRNTVEIQPLKPAAVEPRYEGMGSFQQPKEIRDQIQIQHQFFEVSSNTEFPALTNKHIKIHIKKYIHVGQTIWIQYFKKRHITSRMTFISCNKTIQVQYK